MIVFAINSATAQNSGSCGENATWTYDTETQKLIISGIGRMADYEEDFSPWYNIRENIKTVIINQGITSIGPYALEGLKNIITITIPEGVTEICDGAFTNCSSLTSVTIPNSVKSIGKGAFWDCSSLTSVTIPNSVKSIGKEAFYYCTKLNSITIPENVETIGERAFSLVPNIIYHGNLTDESNWGAFCINGYIEGGFAYTDNTKKELRRYFGNDSEVTIPDGVTSIGSNAFQRYQMSEVTSVIIPESVTSIGYGAFRYCGFTSLVIPKNVTSIGGEAFFYCTSLTTITLPESVTEIGDHTFDNCTSLTTITIPEGVTEIGSEAFYNCTSLTTITIPEGVTEIGNLAFKGCTSLTTITIPEGVTTIGNLAFWNCTSITSINIPESATKIDNGVFFDCQSLTDVYLYVNPDELLLSIDNLLGYQHFFSTNVHIHVLAEYLDKWEEWNEEYPDKIITFVGDIKRMSDESITISAQTYTGSALTPVVKDGEKTLVEGEDYTITLSEGGCTNVGDYTVTLTGKNPYYYKSAEKTFTINPAPVKPEENTATATDDISVNSNIKIWSFEKTIFVENASKEIVIVDMAGRVVKTVKPENSRIEIQLSNSGVYIVKTGLKTQKIIIQ